MRMCIYRFHCPAQISSIHVISIRCECNYEIKCNAFLGQRRWYQGWNKLLDNSCCSKVIIIQSSIYNDIVV